MKRDFSVGAYNEILRVITKVEPGPGTGFTSWYGDGWHEYASWIDALGLRTYISNVDSYHNVVVTKNIAAIRAINSVFNAVGNVDATFDGVFGDINERLSECLKYINLLAETANPKNAGFTSEKMESTLGAFWKEEESPWGRTEAKSESETNFLKADIDGDDVWNAITGEESDEKRFEKKRDDVTDKVFKGAGGKDDRAIYVGEFGDPVSAEDGKRIHKEGKYDEKATLLENGVSASASWSAYGNSWQLGESGEASIDVCKAEAHAGASAGFYVMGKDGTMKFSPGVKAEAGASFTTFEAAIEGQLLGNENLGLNGDATATVGRVGAEAEVGVNIFDEEGSLDLQLGASASAEAIAGELEGSVGVDILGGEVGAKGSVNYGIGAHADVGLVDGVFKLDWGVTFGVGFSVGLEVDVGGMIEGVSDWVSSWG